MPTEDNVRYCCVRDEECSLLLTALYGVHTTWILVVSTTGAADTEHLASCTPYRVPVLLLPDCIGNAQGVSDRDAWEQAF